MDMNKRNSDIHTHEDIARKVALSGINGIRKIEWQRAANVHVAVNFAMDAGKLDVSSHPKPLQIGMEKLKSDILGGFNASAAPVATKDQTLEQRLEAAAAVPVAMPQKPGVTVGVRYNAPKLGL